MKGNRLPDGTDWSSDWKSGDYAKYLDNWFIMTPNGQLARIDPKRWTITEHEDKTITVSPSIRISTRHPTTNQDIELWHGYLIKGEFISC